MSTSSASIDRLRIATPCPVGWEQMAGDDRVRFCGQCKLNVYNTAELSRPEVENLITRSEGRICAKLYRRADGTVITKDCPVGLRALRLRVSKRVAAVFAAAVSFTSIGFGQQSSTKKGECVPQSRITRTNKPSTSSGQVASGMVMDLIRGVIADAKITLTNTDTGNTRTTKTNDEGQFEFRLLAAGVYSLSVEAASFRKYEVRNVSVDEDKSINMEIILEYAGEVEVMGVVAGSDLDLTTSSSTIIINEQMIRRLPIQK